MTPEQIFEMLSQGARVQLDKQALDAIRFGTGYGRMTEEGFQHVPYPIDPEVIEGEFKVVE